MRLSFWPVLCSLLLTACGGGGGGGDGGNAQTPSTPLALTAANYEAVSQAVLDGTGSLSTLSSGVSPVFTGAALETPPTWMPALISQVKKIKSLSKGQAEILSGVETSASQNCSYGGTLSVSLNDANNNNVLDAGDSMTLSFANCGISSLESANGSLSVVVNNVTEGFYASADIGMSLNNFSVVSGSTTASAVGDMRLILKEYPNYTTYLISGNSLTSSITVSGVTKRSSMTGFSMDLSDALTGADTQSFKGTLAMSGFANQSVVVSTPVAWLQSNGATYPYAGQMLLTGQSGAKIRITALSSTFVRLELDATGDGLYETSKTVTWASLK